MQESEPRSRLFIALPVPSAVKDELCRAQVELQSGLKGDGIRWTKPEQIHLTLKFLGNVADSRIDELIAATTAACVPFPPIQLHSAGFGFFPENRPPRVIWAAVSDEQGHLPKLADAIISATTRFAAENDEKGFSAHLTLGRIRNLKPAELRHLVEATRAMENRSFGKWTTETVEIIRSDMDAQGTQHSTLAKIPLPGVK